MKRLRERLKFKIFPTVVALQNNGATRMVITGQMLDESAILRWIMDKKASCCGLYDRKLLVATVHVPNELIHAKRKQVPYSRKINLAVEPKIAIARILADLNLAVRYRIAMHTYIIRFGFGAMGLYSIQIQCPNATESMEHESH